VKRLTQSVENLVKVLNAVATGIIVQEPSGKIVFVNDAAARIMHLESPTQAVKIGGPGIFADFDYFDEHGAPLSLTDLPGRKAFEGIDEPEALIGYSRHKSTKRIRWTKVKALPIKDDQGKTILSVTVMEDITDLKSTERRLKDANSRITKLLEQTLSVDPSQVIRVGKNVPRSH
jgi:PAS domain-containing protein